MLQFYLKHFNKKPAVHLQVTSAMKQWLQFLRESGCVFVEDGKREGQDSGTEHVGATEEKETTTQPINIEEGWNTIKRLRNEKKILKKPSQLAFSFAS